MISKRFECPHCKSSEFHLAQRRTFVEKHVLTPFGVRPVRCDSCFRRRCALYGYQPAADRARVVISKRFKCPYCEGSECHRSRRRTVLEKRLLPLLGVKPVRCASCRRRALRGESARVLISLVLLAGCIGLSSVSFSFVQKGRLSTDEKNAVVLEREVRQGLPVGSSLPKVENFLAKRKIEFSYNERSRSVDAVAEKLEGSTILISKALQFRFHFDDKRRLKSIDSNALSLAHPGS